MSQIVQVITVLLLFAAGLTILFLVLDKRKSTATLCYINEKLNEIIKVNGKEKLLCITDDKEIRTLLRAINLLLEHKDKILADTTKTEESMKKMLSNISHDLKTPLTVVLGYIETIRLDENLSAVEREVMLIRAHEKAREVLALMNEFFDLAKLESNDREFELKRVHINEVVKKNILSFYELLHNKGIHVEIDIPQEPLFIMGNEDAINRILQNLISNAIQYGTDGNYVGVSLRSDDRFIYVDIKDKGKGIDEVYHERVFERMYSLEDSRNKEYQGSGLGLTITKRLTEKMGGEITLQSKPFENTVFTVRLKRLSY